MHNRVAGYLHASTAFVLKYVGNKHELEFRIHSDHTSATV